MLPPAQGWLEHADVSAAGGVDAGSGGVGGVDPLTCQLCQRLCLDCSLGDVSAAGGVDAGGGVVGSVDLLTCQRLGVDCSRGGRLCSQQGSAYN